MYSIKKQSCFLLIDGWQKITQDVQGLTNDANAVAFQGQGVAASQNMEVEDQITNGFNDVGSSWLAIGMVMLTIAMIQATDSLDKFLDDLSEKASVLNELEQGSAIYTALGSLHSAYAVSHNIDSQGSHVTL